MTEQERKDLKYFIGKNLKPYTMQKIDEKYNPEISDFYDISPELRSLIDKWLKSIDKKLMKLPQKSFESLKVSYEFKEILWKNSSDYMFDYLVVENMMVDTLKIVDDITKHFGFSKNFIEIFDLEKDGREAIECNFYMEGDKIRPNVLIDIVAADVMHNKYILTKFMKERGYVLIQIKHTSLLFGDTLTHFVFASANPRDVTNEIHEKYDYLYHVTSEEHLNNIFSEGKMLPKSRHGDMGKESGIIYSPRIYFLTDIERARKLQFNMDPDSLTAFRIIRLHLLYLPNNVRFYYDPLLSAKVSVYTETEIDIKYIDETK